MVRLEKKENVEIRTAERGYVSQLVDLMNSEYRRKKSENYFLWQYFESKLPTVLKVALENEKLIGFFGLQKKILSNGSQAGQAIDMLVSPEWRGKGVFKQLADRATEHFNDLDILCVFPNLNGKNAVEKSLDWKSIAQINTLVYGESPIQEQVGETKIDYINSDPVYFSYNEEIIDWRFRQHPEYDYNFISIEGGYYSILKLFIEPETEKRFGDVVYMNCDLNDINKIKSLLNKSLEYFNDMNVQAITTWALPHLSLNIAAREVGFKEFPKERFFCIKILNSKFDHLRDINNWHLSQADTEIY